MRPKDLLADLESGDRTADMLRPWHNTTIDYGPGIPIRGGWHDPSSMRVLGYSMNQIITMIGFWRAHNTREP